MAEINVPDCFTHGSIPRALHPGNFEGIVTVIEKIIDTVSGVGTTSYSRCPYGYSWNFEGVVRALEDLNTSISGIDTGTALVVGGSGVYTTPSGSYKIINVDYGVVSSGSLVPGSNIDFGYLAEGKLRIDSLATVSGVQSAVYLQDTVPPETNGALWFDTNEGRLFVYAEASGWYQTNAEALVIKGEVPPSGTNLNAPPRDGSLWFNTLLGSLFIYDVTTSGWYESSPSRTFAYSTLAPAPSAPGAAWYDQNTSSLKMWDGSSWITV